MVKQQAFIFRIARGAQFAWKEGKDFLLQVFQVQFCQVFNPIRAGGGLRGTDDQTHRCQSKTSYSTVPQLCDFQFLFFLKVDDYLRKKLVNRP